MKVAELPLFEHDYKNDYQDVAAIPPVSPEFSDPKTPVLTEYSTGLYEQVSSYFQAQDSDLKQIDFLRDLLGDKATGITDFDLANYCTEIQSLVDCWTDEFEKQLFGLPLQELLGTK